MSSSEENRANREIGQYEVPFDRRLSLLIAALAEMIALVLMDAICLVILYIYQQLTILRICVIIALLFIVLVIRMYNLYQQLIMHGRAQVAERREREWQRIYLSRLAFNVGMSDNQINALPSYEYNAKSNGGSATRLNREGSPIHQASSSAAAVNEKWQCDNKSEVIVQIIEDKLNCTICIDEVNTGELVRSLPCFHEFHANCIDKWLRLRGECPICRSSAAFGMQQHGDGEEYASVGI